MIRSFKKSPIEEFSKGFTPILPSGVTVASCTVSAIDIDTGESANSVLSSTTATILNAGLSFAVFVQGGDDGHDYKITFVYTCSDDEVRRAQLVMLVRE